MYNKAITEQVNMTDFPEVDFSGKKNTCFQISIGDLHANMIKFIYMLVKHGIAETGEENYKNLIEFFQKNTNTLKQQDLEKFDELLKNIKFNTNITIRLIGDEMADRAGNDYLTLKVFEVLREAKVPMEIMISNHSLEFIEAYEKNMSFTDSLHQGQSV